MLEHDVAVVVGDPDDTVGGTSNVLSCEPYSSAFWAMSPTLATLPMVAGSNAPFSRQ
jgi:hypothetical protein